MESQNIAVFVDRMVVLPINNIGDALDVAAEPGKSKRIKVALAAGGIDGIVDGVIGDRRSDGAGDDSVQRAGTGDAAELHLGEQQLGGIVKRGNVGARQSVLQANAGERELADGIAGEKSEAGAGLIVILNELRVDADGLASQERGLAGLVKLVAAGKNRETGGDGPVKKIRLGKPEEETARKIAELRGKSKSLAKAQEVVGLIRKADEAAGQAADAPLQTDGLLALFLELEVDINSAFFTALDLRSLVGLDLVEIVELIEAEDTELPKALVEELAFIDHQLAANDLVTRGGVAAEVNAPDEILLLLVKLHGEVDDFLFFVDFGVRLGSEVDESVFAVNFAVGLEGLADFFGGEDVALFKRESGLEGIDLEGQGFVRIGTDDLQRAHAVAFTLFDRDGDVDGLAVAFSGDEGNAEAGMRGGNVLPNGVADGKLEGNVFPVEGADADVQVLPPPFAVGGLRGHRD